VTDLGEKLRQGREDAGWSLRRMANATHYTYGFLGNVECGKRKATPDVIAAYELVLGDEMQRRTLITGITAATVVPGVVGDILAHGFNAALRPPVPIDEWLRRVDEYGRDYMSVGADELRSRLSADLIVMQQQLGTRRLWAAAARTLTVYGKTIKGAREASDWYRYAAEFADRSKDLDARVWVRGRSALALGYEGAGLMTATGLAEQALAIARKPSLGTLNAHMALAHIFAIQGRRAESKIHLDEAMRAFDAAGSSEQISDFAVPEWRLWTFTSMLLSRMGDPKAAEAQDMADATRPATLPRFATHIEMHRGLALVRSGDVVAGREYARAALDALPPARHSLTLKLLLKEIEAVPAR
jgi:transcriptional regulator with XRE-family HTH domain